MNLRNLRLKLSVMTCAFAMAAAPARAQSYTILHSFQLADDGLQNPAGGLVEDSAGNFYGNTYDNSGNGTVFELSPAGTVTVLHPFAGGLTDGLYPLGRLVLSPSGAIYGITASGGLNSDGTVFKLYTGGEETLLHTFGPPPDGCSPSGGLVRDQAGNLYGTTSDCGASGAGTVFKVNAVGRTETILYSFTGGTQDGSGPQGGVTLDRAGNLYGVTYSGGAFGLGMVYKLDASGKLTVLHSFSGPPDGRSPAGPLLLDAAGNLYGTANYGGSQSFCNSDSGCGVLFRIDAGGNYTVLLNFGDFRGEFPGTALIEDPGGNLYGVTLAGGSTACGSLYPSGCGVLFEFTAYGKEKILHTFGTDTSDGIFPNALILNGSSLYGTTYGGGEFGVGTIFQYTVN